jgi:hypothetical protein
LFADELSQSTLNKLIGGRLGSYQPRLFLCFVNRNQLGWELSQYSLIPLVIPISVLEESGIGTGVKVTRKNSFESLTPSWKDILVQSSLEVCHCTRSVVPHNDVGIEETKSPHNLITDSL